MANVVHNLKVNGSTYPVGTVHYIAGTGTTAGTWLGTDNSITEYYDGLTIAYKIPIAGASTTTLNINGLGAKTVRRNTNNLTTHLPVNTVVILTYTTISGTGYWVWADYNSDTDTKVTQTAPAASSYTNWRPLVLGSSNNSTEGFTPSTVTDSTYTFSTITAQPSSGTIRATTFKGDLSGNSETATKLATARTIDGMSFNGTANIAHYGTCSTAAATAAKVVSLTGFTLDTGARIVVKFTVTNTASSPTLNVNSTGAKAIYYRGSAITAGYLAANRTYEFVYNGTQWDLVGDIDTNTNTNTSHGHSAGTGLTVSGSGGTSGTTTYSVNLDSTDSLGTIGTTSKLYAVGVDENGKLCVNVPWTDTNTTYTFNGAVSTIKDSNLTVDRALVSNSNGKVAVSDVTSTELSYLDGVTSNIQTQLDGKAASSHGNHVPATQTANNAKFLRNDNTWQTVTPANIGAASSSHTHSYLPLSGGTLTGDTTVTAGKCIQLDTLKLPTSSGGTTYGAGSNGQVLKSNGTTVYWASDSNTDTNVIQYYTTTDANYPLLFKYASGTTATTNVTSRGRYCNKVYVNASTGNLVANNIPATGLIWQSF